MQIDVATEVVIRSPRDTVAAFAADPDNVTRWYAQIKSVEWKTPRPLRIGSRMTFVAGFLGRRIEYTYEVIDWQPGERLVMRAADGPFPMETTYTWKSTTDGTLMTLRNRGGPTGFLAVFVPIMSLAVRRSTARDLKRLKSLVERASS